MKQILTFLALTFSYMLCGAQATTLVIDNQTPGWLSSKINYGDQQTVENLTVTGYLNQEDLNFIGTLIMAQALSGLIDIEDCHIVSKTGKETNGLDENMFSLSYNSDRPKGYAIRHLKLPKLLQASNKCLRTEGLVKLVVDTLTVGGPAMPKIEQSTLTGQMTKGQWSYSPVCKNIIFREGVEEISERCFYVVGNSDNKNYEELYNYSSWRNASELESVYFPSTLKTIGNSAFLRCLNLKKINLPDGIESIGDYAFCCTSFQPDTLKLPHSLKDYYVSSFYVKDNQVIVVPNIERIGFGSSSSYKGSYVGSETKLTFYMGTPARPKVLASPSQKCLKSCTFYVPSGSYDSYTEPDNYNPFCFAKVVEMVTMENIIVSPKTISLNINQSVSLVATIKPDNTFNKSIRWESLNESVATVDNNGKVSAIKGGEAKIIVASVENPDIKDECTVTVIQPTTGIVLNKSILELTEDKSEQLVATITPDNATNKSVNWTSSEISVAMVSPDGTVYAVKPGQATIMATTVDGGFVALCKVTVKAKTVFAESLSLSTSYSEMTVGETLQLSASVLPYNTTNKNIQWSSTNSEIATVSESGLVSAIKDGNVQIIASTTDGSNLSAICEISVNNEFISVSQIAINPSSVQLEVGESLGLEAQITPTDATNKKVNWSSTNSSVISVNADGLITANGCGTATIIASTQDGTNLSATCAVVVVDGAGVNDIEIDDNQFVRIYTLNGVLVYEGEYSGSHLASGTYIILSKGNSIKRIIR